MRVFAFVLFVCLATPAFAELCMVEVTRRTPPNSYAMTVLCEPDVTRCDARPPRGLCVMTDDDPLVIERHCTVVKTCTPVK